MANWEEEQIKYNPQVEATGRLWKFLSNLLSGIPKMGAGTMAGSENEWPQELLPESFRRDYVPTASQVLGEYSPTLLTDEQKAEFLSNAQKASAAQTTATIPPTRGQPSPSYRGPAAEGVKQEKLDELRAAQEAWVSGAPAPTITPTAETPAGTPPIPPTSSAKFPLPPELSETDPGKVLSEMLAKYPKTYEELAGPTPTFEREKMQDNPFFKFAWAMNQAAIGKDPYEMIRREEETLRGIHREKAGYAKEVAQKQWDVGMKNLEFTMNNEREKREARKQFIDTAIKANPRVLEDEGFVRMMLGTYKGLPKEFIDQIIDKNRDPKTGLISGFYLSDYDQMVMKATSTAKFIKYMDPNISDEMAKHLAFLSPEEVGKVWTDSLKLVNLNINRLEMIANRTPEQNEELKQAKIRQKNLIGKAKEMALEEYMTAASTIKAQIEQITKSPVYKNNPQAAQYALEDLQDQLKILGYKYNLGPDIAAKLSEEIIKQRHDIRYKFPFELQKERMKESGVKPGTVIQPTTDVSAIMQLTNPALIKPGAETIKTIEDMKAGLDWSDIAFQDIPPEVKANARATGKPVNLMAYMQKGRGATYVDSYRIQMNNWADFAMKHGADLGPAIKLWGSVTNIPAGIMATAAMKAYNNPHKGQTNPAGEYLIQQYATNFPAGAAAGAAGSAPAKHTVKQY